MSDSTSLAVRVRAARAQLALDRKTGRETAQWIRDLAETDIRQEPSPFGSRSGDTDPLPSPRAYDDPALTEIEREVAELSAGRRTSYQIGNQLGLPPEAVQSILVLALKKLGVFAYGPQSEDTLAQLRVALRRLPSTGTSQARATWTGQ